MRCFPLLLVLAACAAGQSHRKPSLAAPAAPPSRQLDVVVTGAGGLPVPNLTAADFDLTVNGKSVAISSARSVDGRPRTTVVVVDDACISASGVERVRTALDRFVNSQMQPDDRLSILRTLTGATALESITADRHLLGASMGEIQFDPSRGGPAGPARDEYVLTGIVNALRRALSGLAEMPGRKAVVLLSENLSAAGRHPDRFAAFARLAALASASLYTVDLSGKPGDSLLTFPAETAGLDLGSGDLSAALLRVLREQQAYYVLSFPWEEGAIRVKARNAELAVHSRVYPLPNEAPQSGFWVGETQAVARALNSPFDGGSIHVQVSPIFGGAGLGLTVSTLLWIDAGDLTFTHQLDGTHKAAADVALTAYGGTGMRAGEAEGRFELQLKDPEYQQMLRDGWLGQLQLRLASPGPYQIRGTVIDAASSRSGSAFQLVDLPDVSSGQMILSSIALRSKDTATVAASAGRRIFAPGETLTFGYQVLNPAPDPQKAVELESTIFLFRGRQEIFQGTPHPLAPMKLADPKSRPVSGELTLGTKLPPGRYQLEIRVADRQPGNPRQAHQWIDFQVRP